MIASELYKRLQPFLLLTNKRAMATSYKALHITPTHIRGYAPFGVMEVEANLGLETEAYVEADRLIQILNNLPAGNLEVSVGDGKFGWACEDSNPDESKRRYAIKGQFACITDAVTIPPVPWQDKPRQSITVNESFGKGLELAALGCGTSALLSVGLYGVTIENEEGGLIAYASDNFSLASCRLADYGEGLADKITLAPDALALLAAVTNNGESSIAISDDAVFCEKPGLRLVVKRIAPLKVDLQVLASGLRGQDKTMPLARDNIQSFIRRVEALAQDGTKATVTLQVEDGVTSLDFDDGLSFSAEFFLVQADELLTVPPIQLEPRRVAKALGAADRIVFDYVDRKALVLRGPNDFMFAVHGKE